MATDFLSSGHSTPSSSGSAGQLTLNNTNNHAVALKILHQDTSTLTLLIDAEFFENRPELSANPIEWSSDILKVIVPDACPNVRLFCAASTRNPQRPQVVAAQFDVADYDSVTSTRLLQHHLSQWLEDYYNTNNNNVNTTSGRAPASSVSYDRRTGRAAPRNVTSNSGSATSGGSMNVRDQGIAKAPLISVPTSAASPLPSPTSSGRPTLFNLIAKLGEPSITTVEQRHAIRQIITDYLNNEISHGKVFSYIGQVIGYQTLDTIINALCVAKPPSPSQEVISATQARYMLDRPGLPSSSTDFLTAPNAAAVSDRQQAFSTLGVSSAGMAKYTPAVVPESLSSAAKQQKTTFIRSLARPLRWVRPTNLLRCDTWGQRLCLLDRKCFMFGGSFHSCDADQGVKKPTFETLRVIDLSTLRMRSATTLLTDCPPSLFSHVAHLGSFASGPITVVHGGAIGTPLPPSESRQQQLQKNVTHVKCEDECIQLNGRLYGMDMLTKGWMLLDEPSVLRPCPRHSHTSAILPYNTEIITGATAAYAEHLIIFGGVGYLPQVYPACSLEEDERHLVTTTVSKLTVLNDIWIFDFMTAQWRQVDISSHPSPSPRFGMSFVWISEDTLMLFGGETRSAVSVNKSASLDHTDDNGADSNLVTPPGKRFILSDTWLLHIKRSANKSQNNIAENNDDKTMALHDSARCCNNKIDGDIEMKITEKQEEGDENNTSEMSHLTFSWSENLCIGPPRAHYAPVALTACLPPITAKNSDYHNPNQTEKHLENELSEVQNISAREPQKHPDQVKWANSVEGSMINLMSLGWASQRVVFLISGTTRNADGAIYETQSLLIGLVFPEHTGRYYNYEEQRFTIIWRCMESVPALAGHIGPFFKGRRNHTAAYFDALAELPSDQILRETLKEHSLKLQNTVMSPNNMVKDEEDELIMKPSENQLARRGACRALASTPTCVPCILVCGGISSDSHPGSDIWILKLSKLHPRFTSAKQDGTLEQKLMNAVILGGFRCLPSLRELYGLPADDVEAYDNMSDVVFGDISAKRRLAGKTDVVGFSVEELDIMRRVWSDPTRNYQPALIQANTSVTAGLLWTLATVVKLPLATFGHLVDNATHGPIKASNIYVCIEKWRGVETISITDNGIGLSHRGLHLLLKRFGYCSDDFTSRGNECFGIGFKLAVGRLAHNALVLTKCGTTYGAGLFSVPINKLMGTTNFACPIACWSASNGFPVVLPTEEAAFGQTVALLLQNSPLHTAKALEEEFEKFGSTTGTRIILFGLRKDLPYPYINQKGYVHFSSYRAAFSLEQPTTESILPRYQPSSSAMNLYTTSTTTAAPATTTSAASTTSAATTDMNASLLAQSVADVSTSTSFLQNEENATPVSMDTTTKTLTENKFSLADEGPKIFTAALTDAETTVTDSVSENVDNNHLASHYTSKLSSALMGEVNPITATTNNSYLYDCPIIPNKDHQDYTKAPKAADDSLFDNEAKYHNMKQPTSTGDVTQTTSIKLPEKLSNIDFQPLKLVKLHQIFPLYDSASTSLDYNLATYLYWLHLHSHATISLNGVELSPKHNNIPTVNESMTLNCLKQAGIELPIIDRYQNSLWRYLQYRLHYKLEFPYLFEPKYGEDNFYGLVGFLNDPLNSLGFFNSNESAVCETGVLLYHKGRLITRAVLGIPVLPDFLLPQQNAEYGSKQVTLDAASFTLGSFGLTAVINVPDFLLPRADKEGFLCDSDLAFHDFYDKLEGCLKEYLNAYKNPEDLKALQERYVNEFDLFREMRWNERRRSGGESYATNINDINDNNSGGRGSNSNINNILDDNLAESTSMQRLHSGHPSNIKSDSNTFITTSSTEKQHDAVELTKPHATEQLKEDLNLNAQLETREDDACEFSFNSSEQTSAMMHASAARKRQNRDDPTPLESAASSLAPSVKAKRRRAAIKTPIEDQDQEARGPRRRRRGYRRRSEEENDDDDAKNSVSDDDIEA